MAMKTESIAINKLILFPHQVRKHGKGQIIELKKSLEMFKQTRAIVIDEKNTILIGNGLWLAAKELGWKKLDCLRIKGLSDAMKKRLVLADNKIYALGMDDYEEIEALIREVYAEDNVIDIPGFDNESMQRLMLGATAAAGNVPQEEQDKLEESANRKESENLSLPVAKTQLDSQHRKFVICPDCGQTIYLEGGVIQEE